MAFITICIVKVTILLTLIFRFDFKKFSRFIHFLTRKSTLFNFLGLSCIILFTNDVTTIHANLILDFTHKFMTYISYLTLSSFKTVNFIVIIESLPINLFQRLLICVYGLLLLFTFHCL